MSRTPEAKARRRARDRARKKAQKQEAKTHVSDKNVGWAVVRFSNGYVVKGILKYRTTWREAMSSVSEPFEEMVGQHYVFSVWDDYAEFQRMATTEAVLLTPQIMTAGHGVVDVVASERKSFRDASWCDDPDFELSW